MSQTVNINKLEIIKNSIREIPDFPKPGILFRDITTMLANPHALRATIDLITERFKDENIGYVVGLESRGFIFGSAIADRLGAGFILVRKPGKLPAATEKVSYELEYGTDSLEIHKDAFSYYGDQEDLTGLVIDENINFDPKNKRVLIVDDLLATGGTASAAAELIKKVGAEIVGAAFVIELEALAGKDKLPGIEIFSLIKA